MDESDPARDRGSPARAPPPRQCHRQRSSVGQAWLCAAQSTEEKAHWRGTAPRRAIHQARQPEAGVRRDRQSDHQHRYKKKELIGDLYRAGTLYTTAEVQTLDHDFPSLAEGVAIPHGIYDVQKNHGSSNIGTSHDTSEFAADSLRQWWH